MVSRPGRVKIGTSTSGSPQAPTGWNIFSTGSGQDESSRTVSGTHRRNVGALKVCVAGIRPRCIAGWSDPRVPTEQCEQQAALATAVVSAINKVYVVKRDLESAKTKKAETDQLMIALNNASSRAAHYRGA
jgi:hypothetical protein